MICVKVDKASRSASPLRSQCPPARRPPTLRNSYITITSCTYHNIRSRASDPSAPQSVTPPPCPPPRPTRTVRRRPSAQLYISIGRSAIRTRVGEEGVDDDLSKATSRLDDFQFIYTKRGRPSSLRWSLFFCPLFGITRHSRGSARSRGCLRLGVHWLVRRCGRRHQGLLLVGVFLLLHLATLKSYKLVNSAVGYSLRDFLYNFDLYAEHKTCSTNYI